jgi:ribose transport system permease protein
VAEHKLNPGVVAEPLPTAEAAVGLPARMLAALGWLVAIPWIGVLVGIVVIGVVVQTTSPCACLVTEGTIQELTRNFSYVGIAALGGAMVIMTRGIDLSVGSNMALSALITADVLNHGVGTTAGFLIGLSVGLGVGLVNGLLVTVIGMQPFIATLGMLSVVRGAALARSQGFTLYPPTSFVHYGQGSVGPVPNPVFVMLGLMAALSLFLSYTPLGRHIYAVGGNEEAARLLGIKTKRVKLFAYATAGVLGAVGGITLMSFLGTADPGMATGYELDVIAAAVIGGVSLFGGEGTLVGTVLGAALIEEIREGLVLDNVPGYWTDLVIGGVILFAMTIDQARRRLRRA